MTLALTTITNSIAALSISGLTIYDLDEVPMSADPRIHSMYPEPVEFIKNFTPQKAAFGTGSTSSWNVEYDLDYTFLYAPVGAERRLKNVGLAMEMVMQIVDAVLAITTLTGAVQLTLQSISTPGKVADPSGTEYTGAYITFHVLEFVN